nr:DNA polymerase Y family protein [Sphingomonas japonica]
MDASKTRRRFLALFFPFLTADRLALGNGVEAPDAPFVFTEKQRGAMRIVAADPCALALGITPGTALADARAQLPDLVAYPADPLADQLLIERVADCCDRYTPLVAIDPPDGVTLDITGCIHAHGSEAALAADVERRLAYWPLVLRHAIAATPEAAQALARHQTAPAADERQAILRLPVRALRLDSDSELALRRAGLNSIGDLARRPTAPLAARFGEAATAMLARILGDADSRITPRRALPALRFDQRFAEPVARTDAMLAAIRTLAETAAQALEQRAAGGRRFAIRLYRSDGVVRDLAIESGLPMRDPDMLMRLLGDRLDTLADPIDPGFGFDLIRLAVPRIEPLAATQLQLEGGAIAEQALAALVDRLSTRLGRGRIRRFVPADSHIPEQGVLALPAADRTVAATWTPPPVGEPPLRPIHLFDPPQPVEVVAEVPDGPPRRFRWRRTLHEISRFEGPERIAPEWWKPVRGNRLTRDYYRVEDVRGRRFWLFRHGLYDGETADPRWYVHGLFA